MHNLIEELTKYLNLTPEQQFRVSAMIKRNMHEEKADLFHRYFLYSQGTPKFDKTDPKNPKIIGRESARDPWINKILEEKAQQHSEWAKKSDEEIITWSIGTHKYIQKIEPCSVCGAELTGKPYTRVIKNGTNNTFCLTHAPEEQK